MSRNRFISLSDEIGGVLKTFFILWAIFFTIIFIFGGFSKWSFYGGVSLGFILAIISFFILSRLTGVKREKMSAPTQKVELTMQQFREMFK